MAMPSAATHAGGMAIAQKNSTELLTRRAETGTGFAVSEECNHYDECDSIDVYGDAVLMIEYSDKDFDKGYAACPQISIVPGEPAYVYDGC
jgi:Glycoside-hydrolase family GH114